MCTLHIYIYIECVCVCIYICIYVVVAVCLPDHGSEHLEHHGDVCGRPFGASSRAQESPKTTGQFVPTVKSSLFAAGVKILAALVESANPGHEQPCKTTQMKGFGLKDKTHCILCTDASTKEQTSGLTCLAHTHGSGRSPSPKVNVYLSAAGYLGDRFQDKYFFVWSAPQG